MDEATSTALGALRSAALGATPSRVHDDPRSALLQSIVDAAVMLLEAEAASIALFERQPDRLQFHVAAGPQGAGVVGLSVAPTRGLAGYVFSTGESIALSDVTSDPRFDRSTAERTGYVPRSIAAVPLGDEDRPVGVLQVLDRQGSASFTLADMTRLGVFASQATAALRAARVARDTEHLLRSVLVVDSPGGPGAGDAEAILASAMATLDGAEGAPLWGLVDRLVRLRRLSDAELRLIADLLAVLTRPSQTPGRYRLRSIGGPRR